MEREREEREERKARQQQSREKKKTRKRRKFARQIPSHANHTRAQIAALSKVIHHVPLAQLLPIGEERKGREKNRGCQGVVCTCMQKTLEVLFAQEGEWSAEKHWMNGAKMRVAREMRE